MKNVVWHTFASALSIKFVFTFSPKITFFSTTFFCVMKNSKCCWWSEINRNNHSKEQATSILIRNFFIWNMFSLFPTNGNISIWAIYNETYFSFSDKWSKLCILFFNFRILHIRCKVYSPYFTPYLTALNVNCSSKFILSKYLLLLVSSSRHDFLLNEKKKSYNNKKYRSTSAIFHNTTWWIYIPRDPVLTKNLFFIVQDLYECTPPMQFFCDFITPWF